MTGFLVGLVLALALGTMGCSETSGAGGSDGDGGSAGNGGAAGVGGYAECVPEERECVSGDIAPIEEMCEISLPDQLNACDGTESLENPSSCTASGNTVAHKLTKMQVAADCNAGYDLDGCMGSSCMRNSLTAADGVNGVDNALGASAIIWPVAPWQPADVGNLDQAFHDAICTGAIGIEIEVDAVPEEGCAVVRVSAGGVQGDPVPMNLSDDGCLSGTLGTVPVRIGDEDGSIGNAVVRMTLSPQGFSDGILGGTADPLTAAAMFEAIATGASPVVSQSFDIRTDLSRDPQAACDALSMTLEIGGSAIP